MRFLPHKRIITMHSLWYSCRRPSYNVRSPNIDRPIRILLSMRLFYFIISSEEWQMVATSSMVYEEIVGVRGSWPQPPRTLFTREMPHNLNSTSANSANTGPNHQAYPPPQPYHHINGDAFQPEVRWFFQYLCFPRCLVIEDPEKTNFSNILEYKNNENVYKMRSCFWFYVFQCLERTGGVWRIAFARSTRRGWVPRPQHQRCCSTIFVPLANVPNRFATAALHVHRGRGHACAKETSLAWPLRRPELRRVGRRRCRQ